MTIHDFNIGEVWRTHLGRRVEIVATKDFGGGAFQLGVIAYRPQGLQLIQLRDVEDTTDWIREVE